MPTNFDPTTLPLFAEQKNSFSNRNDFSLYYYLQLNGTVELAIALGELFWPRITIVNGCYLRTKGQITRTELGITPITLAEQQQAESLYNHFHVYDLFYKTHPDTPLIAYEYIAELLLEMWKAALHQQYPKVVFCFEYATEPDAYGPTITFWHTDDLGSIDEDRTE